MSTLQLETIHRLRSALDSASDQDCAYNVFADWLKADVNPRLAVLFIPAAEKNSLHISNFIGLDELPNRVLPIDLDPWEWLSGLGISLPHGERFTRPVVFQGRTFGLLAMVSARKGGKLAEEKLLLELGLAYLGIILNNIQDDGGFDHLPGSEKQYRTLFENAPVGIGVADLEGNLLTFNDAMLKPGGYTHADIRKLGNVAALYYDIQEREQTLTLFRKQGFLHQHPVMFKRKDGTAYDALLTLTPVMFGGKPCVQAVVEDITVRKRTEQALRLAEEKYRNLVEKMPLVMYLDKADEYGTSIYISPQIKGLLGYSPAEFMDNPRLWHDLIFPDDYERAMDTIRTTLKSGHVVDEYRMVTRDGRVVWVRDSSVIIQGENGKPEFVQGFIEDITERRQAEKELVDAKILLEKIFSGLDQAVFVISTKDRMVLACNPAVERIFGYTEKELVGKNTEFMYVDHLEYEQYPQKLSAALDASGVYHAELQMRRKDGSIFPVEVTETAILDSAGERTGVASVIRDITERKLHERELEAEAMLAQALGETLDLDSLLVRLLEAARHAIPAAGKGSVMLVEPDGALRIHAMIGYKDLRLQNFTFVRDSGYSARAAREKKPLLFSNVRADANIRYDGEIEDARDIHSAIVAPMLIQDRVIGVIALDSTEKSAFNEADLRLLSKFAASAALIVERSHLFDETHHRAREMAALLETSMALNILDMDSILRTIGERAKALFAADGCRIFLLEPDGETLRCVLALQESPDAFHDLTIKVGQGITGAVAASGEAEMVNAMQDDPRAVQVSGTPEEEEAIIFAPLKERERTLGVISVRRVGAEHPFESSDLELLKAFASMAASAVSNARLFDDTQKRLAELSVLHKSSQSLLVSGFDAEATYAGVHEAVTRVMPSDAFVIVLDDGKQGDYHAVYRHDKGVQYPPAIIPRGKGLSGQVISKGKTLLISDHHDRKDVPAVHFGDPQHVRSILAIPLHRGGRTFGMISTQSYQPNMYGESHREVLETIAAQFASSIEIARLFEETQQRLHELEILQTVSAELRQAHTVQEMLPIFVKYAARAVDAQAGSIYLLEESSGEWVSQGWINAEGNWVLGSGELRHKPGEGVTGWVGERGEVYIIDDWRVDSRSVPLSSESEHLHGLQSGISLPFRAEEHIVGVMHIWFAERHVFMDSEKHLLTAIADMAGNALQRARLHEETARQLKRLSILRDMDRVIASSFDLRIVFNILLTHVIEQLKTDAANVLLFNPHTHMLEHAAGRGFRSSLQSSLELRLGESLAGRAAMERKIISIPDLDAANEKFSKHELLEGEDFKAYYAHPLITKGEIKGVLEVFHRTPLHVTSDWLNFFETLAGQAAIAIDNARLFENLERSNLELMLAYDKTIEGWSKALDLRDRETEGHTRRVAELTLKLAQKFGFNRADILHIRRGALLHDIGKIGIPDHILLKPGNLSEDEWVIMRQHPQIAYDMLSSIAYLRPALDIPYCHHEKWDGSGYPRRLKGKGIPIAARIFAVADVWDALTSHRPYRPAWIDEQAREYIRAQAGKHFDPKVVEAFFTIIEE
jgi:PAS domain S-box-containing protein/putative nucleotidyltransferase with HDIG domain